MTTFDPVVPLAGHTPAEQRAADFFQRKRFWEWTASDQADLDAWLAESALHRVAYMRIESGVARASELAALNPLERPRPNGNGGFKYRGFILPLLAAASVTLAATFGGRFVAYLMQPSDSVNSTEVGGRTLLTYGDHTQIELNTNTAVRVRMTTAERTVWLDKGEAWFHVTHDAQHPFRVIVGQQRITDLGTEFLVRRDANNVDVALLSGRATLSAEGAQTSTLKPGDEATATSTTISVTRKTPQELDDELAWRRGTLVFRNTPLSEVVREFNRYNTTKLVIVDPSIAGEPITANIRTDNFESFLQLAEIGLKLHVERKGNEIFISRGQREKRRKAVRLKHGP